MNTDIQIRNYLDGRMESGLLLIGNQHERMYGDTMKVASSILSCDADALPSHPDFLLIKSDKKNTLGVTEIQPILEKSQLQPAISDRQVVIVDGFDKVTESAQNKLLKFIEESELVFIAIAKEDRVLPTVKSRVRVIAYSPLSIEEFYSVYKGGGSLLPVYFATGGDPAGKPDDEVLHIFENVEKVFMENNRRELFNILSQIKEKDNSSFFNKHKEYVSSLVSLIGTLGLKTGNNWIVPLCHKNKKRCTMPSYTGNDFFLFVSGVVDGGK